MTKLQFLLLNKGQQILKNRLESFSTTPMWLSWVMGPKIMPDKKSRLIKNQSPWLTYKCSWILLICTQKELSCCVSLFVVWPSHHTSLASSSTKNYYRCSHICVGQVVLRFPKHLQYYVSIIIVKRVNSVLLKPQTMYLSKIMGVGDTQRLVLARSSSQNGRNEVSSLKRSVAVQLF